MSDEALKIARFSVVNEHLTASVYMRNNRSIIQRHGDKAVVLKPMSFPAPKNDAPFKNFINTEPEPAKPENKKILLQMMEKYGLSDDILLLNLA